jgi:alcohol dehydrogenase
MSILLPYGLEYNMHKSGEYTAELLYALAGEKVFAKTPKEQRAYKTVEFIRNLNQALYDATGGRHARCLKEIMGRDGKPMVPASKLETIAKVALGDASIFYNPEDLDKNDMLMVLTAAWEGVNLDQNLIKKG